MDPETLISHNTPLVLTRDNLAIRKAFPSVQKQQPPKCVCRVSQKAINNASFIVLSPIEPAITDKPMVDQPLPMVVQPGRFTR